MELGSELAELAARAGTSSSAEGGSAPPQAAQSKATPTETKTWRASKLSPRLDTLMQCSECGRHPTPSNVPRRLRATVPE